MELQKDQMKVGNSAKSNCKACSKKKLAWIMCLDNVQVCNTEERINETKTRRQNQEQSFVRSYLTNKIRKF